MSRRQSLAALGAGPTSDADRAFYEGKISSARFFAREVLPRLASGKLDLRRIQQLALQESE